MNSALPNILFEMSEAVIITGKTMDNLTAGTVPSDKDGSQRRTKTALLYSGDLTKHLFMETVGRNRGYNFRVFNNKKEALSWLSNS